MASLLAEAVDLIRDYGILILDPDGNILTWNEGAARLQGYSIKEILGQNFRVFYLPEDIARRHPEAELREAKKTGRYEEEGLRKRKDGSQFWASVIITAIRDQRGRLIGFSKVTRDLTEKKRTEDKLQKAYNDLEQRVQERTNELTKANDALEKRESELKEAVRVRDEFLSIASHELKTPITSLKMQLQMLRQKTNPERGELPSPERLAKGIESSLRQIDRLTKLVEELLDVARAQAQKVSFHLEHTDLSVMVQEVVDRLREQIDAAGCKVRLETRAVWGEFDRFRLDQVLVNLITNALKYAPGSMITIVTRKEKNFATLIVKDEGSGIPPENMARLFERFERGTNAQNINGLGLGLFISKQIVEGHRGTIRAESAEGRGTSFILRLPILGNAGSLPEVRK